MREDVIAITLGLPEFRVLRVEESHYLIEVWVEKTLPLKPVQAVAT